MYIFSFNTTVCFIILLILNYALSKKKLLIDNPKLSDHKYKHKKNIPLSGGIFFILSYFALSTINNNEIVKLFYLFPFFFIGIIADTTEKFSPKLRLILQLLFIFVLIYFLEIKISSIDLLFFDYYLNHNVFNFFFVSFCLITVLNGHNLMDGLNGFVSGNLLLISISIFFIISNNNLVLGNDFHKTVEMLITICLIFFLFNVFGLCFLGDNGIYIFSLFISLMVIAFVQKSYDQVSPLVAASFLWYPAYENLFTIIRRFKKNKSISRPDKFHLHILLKNLILKKFKKKLNYSKLNSISGIFINIFLLPNFILSIYWYDSSIKLLYLIIFQIIIYMFIYIILVKKNN